MELPLKDLTSPRPQRVVIVGGGAAGAITAAHLARVATPKSPLEVTLIERDGQVGPGLAYGTRHPLHALNNFAGRLSAYGDDPDHLLGWCATKGVEAGPQSFLPRSLYGRYLAALVDGADIPDGSLLRRSRGTAVDVSPVGDGFDVHLSNGRRVPADRVVLALGNPPPRPRPDLDRLGRKYLPDPWCADLSDRVHGARTVLLLGTGLTMVDVAVQIADAFPRTRITAVSRHGLLPTTHLSATLRPHDGFHPGTRSLSELLASVRERIAEVEECGGSWRDVVDSIRMYADDLWRDLATEDQDRFVRHVARLWDVHRHRMAPSMAERISDLMQAGTLTLARPDSLDYTCFDRVVNCTGPAPVPSAGWSALVDALLRRGLMRPHRLGLGVDLDQHGQLLSAAGRPTAGLFAIGAARRGSAWEVAAIPDIRQQAAALAETVQATESNTRVTGVL